MSHDIHHAAAQGFTNQARTYARFRPDYPDAAAEWLTRDLLLHTGQKVAEVGSGTGKFTVRLVKTGADVIAIEPVAAMRDQLRKVLPGVTAIAGTAGSLPLENESVDAVVCAQAFHWFASGETLDEFARVLKPEGRLGLIWNLRDLSAGWVEKLQALINAYEGDAPRYSPEMVEALFPHPGFGPLHRTEVLHFHQGPAEDVIVRRFQSVSFIAALPDPEQNQVLERIRRLVSEEPDLAGKDEVRFPYQTQMFWAVKAF